MIIAINSGRKGSRGFPRKNTKKVLGFPLAYYSTKAAVDTPEIDIVYMSTDDIRLKNMSNKLGIEIIDRPHKLCTDKAGSGDVFLHAFHKVQEDIKPHKIEFLVLLMANAFCITPNKLSEAIKVLRENPEYDSAVTVSKYNMWNPSRARKINKDGLLEPYAPETLEGATSDRNSTPDCWFADMGASIVRPRCLKNLDDGLPPQKWMGQKIYPIKQEAGFDIDYKWQMPLVKYWIKNYWRKNK